MNNKVAVIVPVYNTEKYLGKCIDSILNQTYTNFRLLLINDGSPDNAGSLCDNYAKKDERITVLHQKNSGVTQARANGVKLAHDCDYITFVDSDDTLPPTALSDFVSAMTDDSDIAISYRVANIPECQPIEEPRIKVEDYIRGMLYWKISPAPWGKLFRRELFNEYIFDIPREISIGEDLLMNLRIAYRTNKPISIVHNDVYCYNIYDENTTKRFIPTPQFEAMWHRLIVASILNENEKINFIRFSIPHRIQKFFNLGGMEPDVKWLVETEFYKDLKEDIRLHKYHIRSFRKRILLNSSNTLLRTIFIKGKEFVTKLKRSHKEQ